MFHVRGSSDMNAKAMQVCTNSNAKSDSSSVELVFCFKCFQLRNRTGTNIKFIIKLEARTTRRLTLGASIVSLDTPTSLNHYQLSIDKQTKQFLKLVIIDLLIYF